MREEEDEFAVEKDDLRTRDVESSEVLLEEIVRLLRVKGTLSRVLQDWEWFELP